MAGLGQKKASKLARKLKLGHEAAAAAAATAAAATAALPASRLGEAAAAGGDGGSAEGVAGGRQDSVAVEPGVMGHQWHGQQVVMRALARGGEDALTELVRAFRQAFMDACQPRHLPPAWSVGAVDDRAFGAYSVYSEGREGQQQQQQ